SQGNMIDQVMFDDGTVWDRGYLSSAPQPLPFDYITAGSAAYDTSNLDGTVVYDLATGTFGNVSAFHDQAVRVIWGAGDSSQAFTIKGNNFQNTGSVALSGLNSSDVAFYRSGGDLTDLTIQNKTTGETLTIVNEFANFWQGIGSITFGNGT